MHDEIGHLEDSLFKKSQRGKYSHKSEISHKQAAVQLQFDTLQFSCLK